MFVPVHQLEQVLETVTNDLPSQLRLFYQHPSQIYASTDFHVARHGLEVFIQLFLPVVDYRPVQMYQLITTGLIVPGNQGFITKMKNVPKYIIFDPARVRIGIISEKPPVQGMIDQDAINFQYVFSSSCW